MLHLKMPQSIYNKLIQTAEREAPLEACGLLAGNDLTIHAFYPLTNMDASAEHYSMDPAEQFNALKDMRKHGWQIVGIWHSHPATAARMSVEDQKLALMPGVSYVILSLAAEHRGEIKSFRKIQDGSFAEQKIELFLDEVK